MSDEILRLKEVRDVLSAAARDAADDAMDRAKGNLPPGQRHETIYDALGIEPATSRRKGRPAIGARERRAYLAAWEKLKPGERTPANLAETIPVAERTLRRWLAKLPGLPTPE